MGEYTSSYYMDPKNGTPDFGPHLCSVQVLNKARLEPCAIVSLQLESLRCSGPFEVPYTGVI